jgi:cell division transport system ATP-binding protein
MFFSNIEFINAAIFQDGKAILENINVNISKGEFVYLVGKVGSGKSSFIKTLIADIPLQKGEGRILGYQLHKFSRKEIPQLRRKVGVVFQDFQLLTDRNVHDNLKFVLQATEWTNEDDIKKRIKEVLQKVGIVEKEFRMPNQLSGGEQQRVVIARALLNDPLIILADEPTGNIDPATSDEIMKILLDIQKNGRTVVMATHDYPLIKKYPSRILKFENGLISDHDHYEEIYDFKILIS